MSKKILYTFEVWSGGYGGGYETPNIFIFQ